MNRGPREGHQDLVPAVDGHHELVGAHVGGAQRTEVHPVYITENMVGHRSGVCATRIFKGHTTRVAEGRPRGCGGPAAVRRGGQSARARRRRGRREARGKKVERHDSGAGDGTYIRTSAQKAGLLDLIRGKDVNRALATLRFTGSRWRADVRRCCARRLPMPKRRTGSAATWTSCSCRVLRQPGPSQKRCGRRRWVGHSGLKRTAQPNRGGVGAAEKIVAVGDGTEARRSVGPRAGA